MKGKHPLFENKKGKIFNEKGGITLKSVGDRAQFFLGKSVARLESELHKHGYTTTRRPSSHSGSKAKIIDTLNSNSERNITMVQVSPGSKRHGESVAYVKISTNNLGRIKIVNAFKNDGHYKTDGSENATIFYRRK